MIVHVTSIVRAEYRATNEALYREGGQPVALTAGRQCQDFPSASGRQRDGLAPSQQGPLSDSRKIVFVMCCLAKLGAKEPHSVDSRAARLESLHQGATLRRQPRDR